MDIQQVGKILALSLEREDIEIWIRARAAAGLDSGLAPVEGIAAFLIPDGQAIIIMHGVDSDASAALRDEAGELVRASLGFIALREAAADIEEPEPGPRPVAFRAPPGTLPN